MNRHVPLMAAVLSGALLVAGTARADAVAEAARAYQIDTGQSTQSVKVGEKGRLVLLIQPSDKWHVHPQAPLKVRLESSSGMKLEKSELGHEDAVERAAAAPRFEVPFLATAAGKQEARASVDFFVCSDTACVKQTRAVVIPVQVSR